MLTRNHMSRRCPPCPLSPPRWVCPPPPSATGRVALSLQSSLCSFFSWPPRQLLPSSLEPIKRIKNLCTRNHLLNILASLLLSKNNPTTRRKPDEVQPCSGLAFSAWKRGVSLALLRIPGHPLSDLRRPAASRGEEHLRRGGDGAVRGGGARPTCWHQIRSQRKEWKPIIFYIYTCIYIYIIFFFFGEGNHVFLGTHFPPTSSSLCNGSQ